jgi:hypothetical protein
VASLVDEMLTQPNVVKRALKRGVKACHIVTLDWYEDSIIANRKLSEKDFSLRNIFKEERAQKRQKQQVIKGNELAGRFINTSEDFHLEL